MKRVVEYEDNYEENKGPWNDGKERKKRWID